MRLKRILKKILNTPGYLWNKRRFGMFGQNSHLQSPLRIEGGKRIIIHPNVYIRSNAWLSAVPLTGQDATLIIMSGTVIGDFAHIYSTRRIEIEEKVLMANNVYISDNLHSYQDIDRPIIEQPILQKNTVRIGRGSWIGEHVAIIGASVGCHCVVGANSVVTHDVPDYCVVAGIPARIIKKYDFQTSSWRRTDMNGNFIDL